MAKYPPAYQYYPNDFDGSTSSWSLAEVGMYQRLLNYQWVNGFVPSDTDEIMRISRATPEELKRCWSRVSRKFVEAEEGRLNNLRLEEIRKKTERFSRSQAEKGRAGGKARSKKAKLIRGQAGAEPASKPGASQNEALPFSTSTTTTGEANASPPVIEAEKQGDSTTTPPSRKGSGRTSIDTDWPDLPDSLNVREVRKALAEFDQHRNEKRAKMTPTAKRRMLLKMEPWGPEKAVRAIYESISNGYTGVFEPAGNGRVGQSAGPTVRARRQAEGEQTVEVLYGREYLEDVEH